MPEFLVTGDITFPAGMPLEQIRELLARESTAAAPYLDSGDDNGLLYPDYGSARSARRHRVLASNGT